MKFYLLFFFLLPFVFGHSQNDKGNLTVYFAKNSDILTIDSQRKLDSLLNTAVEGNFFIERLVGYCDEQGSNSYNSVLASKRIEAVSRLLDQKKIPITEKIAAGEDYPPDAKSLNNYAKWRKVEIYYLIAEPVRVEDSMPESDPLAAIDIESLQEGNKASITLEIQFLPGEDVLIGNSYEEIMKLYRFLSAYPTVYAFIRGHVCCADDFPLSTARAYVVYSILVKQGISPNRLRYEGFSNTKPAISPEITDADRQKNRRVDVIFSMEQK